MRVGFVVVVIVGGEESWEGESSMKFCVALESDSRGQIQQAYTASQPGAL